MIGTQENATTIARWYHDNATMVRASWYPVRDALRKHGSTASVPGFDESLPRGWMVAGVGSARMALIGPDAVIYKVDRDTDQYQTVREWRVYQETTSDGAWPDGVRPALMQLIATHLGNVMACEWVMDDEGITDEDKGWKDGAWTKWFNLACTAPCGDQHSNNFMVSDGEVVVVDLGI